MKISKKINGPLKYHGGKNRLCSKIISIMEHRDVFCEPMIGGGSVLLNIEEKFSHRYAFDLSKPLINMWVSLRDESDEMIRRLREVSYNEETFNSAKSGNSLLPLDGACDKIINHKFSRGGLSQDFAWSDRKRGGLPGDVNMWKNFLLNHLPRICEKIQGVVFDNCSYEEGYAKYNLVGNPDVISYFDPPYLSETRTAKKVYDHEMSSDDHVKLLSFIKGLKGISYLSCYPSELYSTLLEGYKYIDKEMPNNSGQGKTKNRRIERLYKIG